MKKALIFLLALSGCAFSDLDLTTNQGVKPLTMNGPAECVDLLAGQNTVVGQTCVYLDTNDLIVWWETIGGWTLDEVHLWVGTDLGDMPLTTSGNPQIGLFPYTAENVNDSSFSFVIPLESLGGLEALCGDTIYIAAHAAVSHPEHPSETAWADGEDIGGSSWATMFETVINCEEEPDAGVPELECETAFAVGDTTFIDLGLTDSRWGWVLGPVELGSYEFDVYAGAGRNDLDKGEFVGTLSVDYDGNVLLVSFNPVVGAEFNVTHLYASADQPTTIAPGQYGNTNDGGTDFELSGFNGEPLYLIAHAEVCASE